MRKHFFWLRYPDPATLGAPRMEEFSEGPKEDRIELAREGVPLPTRQLEGYLHDRGLTKYKKRIHLVRLRDRSPVRWTYVPQSGDVIQCSVGDGGGAE